MAVRNYNGSDTLFILLEIRGIRERVVSTWSVVLFFKMEADIKHEDVVVAVYGDHVAADFFYAAQWYYAHYIFCRRQRIVVFSAFYARTSDAWAAQYSLDSARD